MGRVWRSGWHWLAGLMAPALLAGGLFATPVLFAAPVVEEQPDVRVIIDVSGSMRHNDPDQLAADALELLVALLPGGVPAGVWTFGETVANPLPLAPVDAQWRTRAMALAPQLVEYQPFTDIEAAVREAAVPDAQGWRHLVLLTDGMIDLPPRRGAKPAIDEASRRALLETLGPRLADEGVAVHAIAFSDEADLALVERLSQLTGGLSAPVDTADALLGAFLNIVDRIFPSDRVPLTEGRFVIEPGLEAFTALLFHDASPSALTLVAPDGGRFTVDAPPEGGRWRSEAQYDLVQVPTPAPGQWRLEGEVGADSRITVVSPLSLQTTGLPATLYLGFDVPVEAWLAREGRGLSPDELPAHLQLTAELRDASGAMQSVAMLAPRSGRFAGTLPAPAFTGTAQLVVRAEGQGFRRQRVQAVNVLPAIAARHDESASRVLLVAEHPGLHHDNTRLHGELQGVRLDAEPLDAGRWVIPLPELDPALSLPLMLRAQVTLDSRTRELRLPRLLLFPDGRTGLDRARGAAALDVERFHEALEPVREPAPSAVPGGVERLTARVGWLAQRIQGLWNGGRAVIEQPLGDSGRDPRRWAAAWLTAGLGLLVLLTLLWRRLRRPPRVIHREEPHV
jgi:hypothetical protein